MKLGLLVAAVLIRPEALSAQTFSFRGTNVADSTALRKAVVRLADQVLAATAAREGVRDPNEVFRLELVARQYPQAERSLEMLRAQRRARADPSAQARALDLQYEVYAAALTAAAQGASLRAAFRSAFRRRFASLDDLASALAIRTFGIGASPFESALDRALAEARSNGDSVSLPQALSLLRAYQMVETYRALAALSPRAIAEDDLRRYVVATHLRIRMPDGGTVCAMVVRPRGAPTRRPALLQFTIYADSAAYFSEARRAAAHGYAGVIGYTRGKACSPDRPVPYVHDGADADALIRWIARQSWSDGRVGMYGGSYSGFTPWAALKHPPRALKAIMVGAPAAPGIDVPMEGNVFWNFLYPWPLYTTNNTTVDAAIYNDNARWNRLNRQWYLSGRAYRDLDQIDGTPNPIWDEWIAHPSYDSYWQAMIPFEREFADIHIPVLQTAGYFFGGPGAALYYLTQHYRYDPGAEHYLLIGPYDHFGAQRGVVDGLGDTTTVLAGYQIDPVARIDLLADLRYRWFDHVLRGGPKPPLLADRINYEVMGANVWKHAPSIAAMANGSLRFYLDTVRTGREYLLDRERPPVAGSIRQTVDFRDRSDVDRVVAGGGVRDTAADTWNGLEFVSEPLTQPTELSGLFSGVLDLVTNKKDFDFSVELYELTSGGEYLRIPPYWARASAVGDLTKRRLLTPGARARIAFRSVRLASIQLRRGSRIVVVLSILKSPGQEIDYGSGKPVSEETVGDAGAPLRIEWFNDSHIDLPVWRAGPGGPNTGRH